MSKHLVGAGVGRGVGGAGVGVLPHGSRRLPRPVGCEALLPFIVAPSCIMLESAGAAPRLAAPRAPTRLAKNKRRAICGAGDPTRRFRMNAKKLGVLQIVEARLEPKSLQIAKAQLEILN